MMSIFNLIQLIIIGQVYGNYQVTAPTTNAYPVIHQPTKQPTAAYPVIAPAPTGYPIIPQPLPAYPVQQSPAPVHYPVPPRQNSPNVNRKCHRVTKVFDVCENDQAPPLYYPVRGDHHRDIRYNQGLPTVYITLPCGIPVPTHHPVHQNTIPPPPSTTSYTTALPASHPVYQHRTRPHTTAAVIPSHAVIPTTTPCTTFTVKVTSVVYHTAQSTPCTTTSRVIPTHQVKTTTPSAVPTYQVKTTTPCTTTPSAIPTYQVKTTTPSAIPTYHIQTTTPCTTTTTPVKVIHYSRAATTTPCTTTTTNTPYLVNYNTHPIQYAQEASPTKAY